MRLRLYNESLVVFMFVLLSFVIKCNSEKCSLKRSEKEVSEMLYNQPMILTGKILKIKRDEEFTLITLRIRKLHKVPKNIPEQLKSSKEIIIKQQNSLICGKLRRNRRYVFMLQFSDNSFISRMPPLRSNKLVQKVVRKMSCTNCTSIPVLKPLVASVGIRFNKWTKLVCRLARIVYPIPTFQWTFQDTFINTTKVYRIRSNKRSSTLQVVGSADTAGNYKCIATNLAGVSSESSVLYVHGTVSVACENGYCLNGGTCSIHTIYQGEQQIACYCTKGFNGNRCEYRTVYDYDSTSPQHQLLTSVLLPILCTILLAILSVLGYLVYRVYRVNRKLKTASNAGGQVMSGVYSHRFWTEAPPRGIQESPIMEKVEKNGTLSSKNQQLVGSSVSSMASLNSVKCRRPKVVAENLILHISESSLQQQRDEDCVDFGSRIKAGNEQETLQLLGAETSSPNPSPLYTEPWDTAVCVHYNHAISCKQCKAEAEQIVLNCSSILFDNK